MNRTMTVAQLSAYIKGVFDDEELLHDVTLVGEIAEVSYSDRHTFLVLADGAFSVRCVHFSSRDQLEKGMRVAVKGTVSFYDKRNSVSFNYREYFLQGEGDKLARLAALKQKLCDLGYFENRPALPRYITSVAVITSRDGAAIRDLIRVVHDKCPFVSVKVYPVKVQGEGAAAQMTAAIRALQSHEADAIVLCRGGGSDEDLDTFNDEQLATAVALSQKPVISAVGHEVNYTLCDFCAGTRAGTPSIAGEVINSHALAIVNDLYAAAVLARNALSARYAARLAAVKRCGDSVTRSVSRKAAECRSLVAVRAGKAYYAAMHRLSAGSAALSTKGDALRRAGANRLSDAHMRCDKLGALLSALDPHRIIKVGYAAVRCGNRRISRAEELHQNDNVDLVFADGLAQATVTRVLRNKT